MLPRRDVQFIGDVMEYTREQALTIVNFLDDFGIGSFVEGFKDGMLDCRNWLTGKPIALDPDNGLIDIECYMADFTAAGNCMDAWLSENAYCEENLASMRKVVERLEGGCQDAVTKIEKNYTRRKNFLTISFKEVSDIHSLYSVKWL